MNTRLSSLDYLRGFSALGIMVYHYMFWLNGAFTSDQFMGRVGVYGVAVFYVLSGLTLFHVYEQTTAGANFSISHFFKKRIYRIFPLLWLVTLSSIVLSRKLPNLVDVLLNLTGLFGFLRWDVYFSTGVWSIGNELVFYSIFPLIMYVTRRSPSLLFALLLLSAFTHHFFAFQTINTDTSLSDQWHSYVNPLNQFFFFLSGCVLAYLFKKRQFKTVHCMALIALSLVVFVAYPASGDTVQLITGTNRWIFSLASILLCLGFYKATTHLPSALHRALSLLGEGSYSLYLLHPLVYIVWAFLLKSLDQLGYTLPFALRLLSPMVVTLVLSYFVYERFEKFFMRLGRQSSPGSPS